MIFENILIYYNDKSRLFNRRNVGILEVCDTELKLYHSDYSKTINYNDITSVELKGGKFFVNIDYVSITLKNGDFYNLKYLYTNIYEKKEAERKTKLLLRIIVDRSKR